MPVNWAELNTNQLGRTSCQSTGQDFTPVNWAGLHTSQLGRTSHQSTGQDFTPVDVRVNLSSARANYCQNRFGSHGQYTSAALCWGQTKVSWVLRTRCEKDKVEHIHRLFVEMIAVLGVE
ncbi:hypothetical protein BsWGS_13051 [Bradybaena similaris]